MGELGELEWPVTLQIGDQPAHVIGTASGADPHEVMDNIIGLLRAAADELELAQQETP